MKFRDSLGNILKTIIPINWKIREIGTYLDTYNLPKSSQRDWQCGPGGTVLV
jgi:hypothetical protein